MQQHPIERLIFARRPAWADSIAINIGDRNREGTVTAFQIGKENIVLPEGDDWYEPTLRLTPTDAQRLMDEMWNCGLRPSEGSGSAGALAATERHLKDMQRLVFKDFA